MKRFFSTLIASISSLEYYHSVIFRPFGQVFSFYVVFLLLCSGILTIQYWYHTLPRFQANAEQILVEVSERYPQDLRIYWTGQELQLNQYPLLIPLPSVVPKSIKDNSEYLVVVTDTTTKPSDSSYSTFFIASKTEIYPVNEGEVSDGLVLSDLLSEESFEITKDNLPDYIDKARNLINDGLIMAGYFIPLLVFLSKLVSSIYILVLDTLIIFLFVRLQRLAISYKQLFQLGIALLVPAQIIDVVTNLAQLDVPISMLSLSFWVLFILVFFTLQRKVKI